jgi:hypothetical protein
VSEKSSGPRRYSSPRGGYYRTTATHWAFIIADGIIRVPTAEPRMPLFLVGHKVTDEDRKEAIAFGAELLK